MVWLYGGGQGPMRVRKKRRMTTRNDKEGNEESGAVRKGDCRGSDGGGGVGSSSGGRCNNCSTGGIGCGGGVCGGGLAYGGGTGCCCSGGTNKGVISRCSGVVVKATVVVVAMIGV